MPHYSHLEALAADRIRSWFAEAEESRLAHHARTDSRATRPPRGQDGPKRFWLPPSRRSATDMACDAPSIRLQRRAS